jgi:hypothetical protein
MKRLYEQINSKKNQHSDDSNSLLKMKEIKFSEVKTNIKYIFEDFCFYTSTIYMISNLIPFFQILILKFYSDQQSFFDYLIIYSFGIFFSKILSSINEIFLKISFIYMNEMHINKDYYEIGNVLRKSILISLILNFLILFVFSMFKKYFIIEVYTYLIISLFAQNLYSINSHLFHLNYISNRKKEILSGKFIKIMSNVFICFMLINPSNERNIELSQNQSSNIIYSYDLYIFAVSDLLSDFCLFLYFLYAQLKFNPYPQVWIHFNIISIFKFKEITQIFKVYFSNFLIIDFIIDVWYEILAVINIQFFSHNYFSLIIISFIFFKNLICNPRYLLMEIFQYFSQNFRDFGSHHLNSNFLNIAKDFPNLERNENEKNNIILRKIKTKIFGIIIFFTTFNVMFMLTGKLFITIGFPFIFQMCIFFNASLVQMAILFITIWRYLSKRNVYNLKFYFYFVLFLFISILINYRLNYEETWIGFLLCNLPANYVNIFLISKLTQLDIRIVNLEKMKSVYESF